MLPLFYFIVLLHVVENSSKLFDMISENSFQTLLPNIHLIYVFLWGVQTLESCGWEVVEPHAGVSMVAKPSAYLDKVIRLKDSKEIKINDSNIREAMLRATGLCINSASWTGIPGYCRITFGLEESEFGQALDCIIRFKDLFG